MNQIHETTTDDPAGRRRLFNREAAARRSPSRVRSDAERGALGRSDRGQGTVEYALVLLAAAALALVVVAWVSRTDTIGRLFDTVVNSILGKVV